MSFTRNSLQQGLKQVRLLAEILLCRGHLFRVTLPQLRSPILKSICPGAHRSTTLGLLATTYLEMENKWGQLPSLLMPIPASYPMLPTLIQFRHTIRPGTSAHRQLL